MKEVRVFSKLKIKNRENHQVIYILCGNNKKGNILEKCALCNQSFGIDPDTKNEEIAQVHDNILDIDHEFEPGYLFT